VDEETKAPPRLIANQIARRDLEAENIMLAILGEAEDEGLWHLPAVDPGA
jgi:hypothetical protein